MLIKNKECIFKKEVDPRSLGTLSMGEAAQGVTCSANRALCSRAESRHEGRKWALTLHLWPELSFR